MNPLQSKALITSFCFLLVILTGFWLSRSGKPYPVVVFTFHKLITMGTIVYLGILLYPISRSTPLQGGQVAAIAIIVVCFLALLTTGGLLSMDKVLPAIVHRLHQVLPYLTVTSVGITLYQTLFAKVVP